jgi:hypothetical protein
MTWKPSGVVARIVDALLARWLGRDDTAAPPAPTAPSPGRPHLSLVPDPAPSHVTVLDLHLADGEGSHVTYCGGDRRRVLCTDLVERFDEAARHRAPTCRECSEALFGERLVDVFLAGAHLRAVFLACAALSVDQAGAIAGILAAVDALSPAGARLRVVPAPHPPPPSPPEDAA